MAEFLRAFSKWAKKKALETYEETKELVENKVEEAENAIDDGKKSVNDKIDEGKEFVNEKIEDAKEYRAKAEEAFLKKAQQACGDDLTRDEKLGALNGALMAGPMGAIQTTVAMVANSNRTDAQKEALYGGVAGAAVLGGVGAIGGAIAGLGGGPIGVVAGAITGEIGGVAMGWTAGKDLASDPTAKESKPQCGAAAPDAAPAARPAEITDRLRASQSQPPPAEDDDLNSGPPDPNARSLVSDETAAQAAQHLKAMREQIVVARPSNMPPPLVGERQDDPEPDDGAPPERMPPPLVGDREDSANEAPGFFQRMKDKVAEIVQDAAGAPPSLPPCGLPPSNADLPVFDGGMQVDQGKVPVKNDPPVVVNPAPPVVMNPAPTVVVNPAPPVVVNPAPTVVVNPPPPVVVNQAPTGTGATGNGTSGGG